MKFFHGTGIFWATAVAVAMALGASPVLAASAVGIGLTQQTQQEGATVKPAQEIYFAGGRNAANKAHGTW